MAFHRLFIFLLLLHIILHEAVQAIVLTMRGGEIISYDLSKETVSTETLRIVFKLKTVAPSGLLLYSENKFNGDFISLELIDGRLRYKARCGFEESSEREQELVVGRNLNNDEWHTIDVKLHGQNVTIQVGDKQTTKTFTGEFVRMDLDEFVYFGGVSQYVDVSSHGVTNRKYAGCLENLMFNDVDILYKAKHSKKYFSINGEILWNECEQLDYQPIMMKNPQDHALLPTYLKHRLNVVFRFRTHVGEGLLFAKISPKVAVYVALRQGVLHFTVRLSGVGPIVMTQGENLHDGFWHRVEFLVNKKIYKLKVDRHAEVPHSSPWSHNVEFSVGNATLGGGEEQIMEGFAGCMYDIWVDNTSIDYRELGTSHLIGAREGCSLTDRCLFSPCKNGGICTQDHKSYACSCMHTMYSGKHCEESIYQPSCQEYKDIGLKEDSYCLIDPDGEKGKIKPFKVMCNVTGDSKKATTIFQHDLKNGLVSVANGIITDDTYHHSLRYGITLEEFDTILDKATECKQYIDFKCKNAYLFRSPRGPADTNWIGRNGNYESYWGGAKPDSGKCACAGNNSCAHPYRYCNCDVGDDEWREDKGYFREVDRLPVFTIIFKLSANQSYFQVGDLQCQFNATPMRKNLSKIRALKACTSINAKTTVRPTPTHPTLNQKEEFINWNLGNGKYPHFGRSTLKPNQPVKPIVPNVNVNVTVELPSMNNKKDEDGLKFTLSVYAVIVIAVATVIVVIIIAVVIIVKRCQQRRRRNLTPTDYNSDDECITENTERTEMCTFFGSVSRSERDRPVIEVHRHSIHCDTLDDLPPAYREFGDYTQPITTHIDLSYRPRKKSLGIFC